MDLTYVSLYDKDGRELCGVCCDAIQKYPEQAELYYRAKERVAKIRQLVEAGKVPNRFLHAYGYSKKYQSKLDPELGRMALDWALGHGITGPLSLEAEKYGDRIRAAYNKLVDRAIAAETVGQ